MKFWNLLVVKGFVRKSNSYSWEAIGRNFKTPCLIFSLTRWQSISRCFVLSWIIGSYVDDTLIATIQGWNLGACNMEILQNVEHPNQLTCGWTKSSILCFWRRSSNGMFLLSFPWNKRCSYGKTIAWCRSYGINTSCPVCISVSNICNDEALGNMRPLPGFPFKYLTTLHAAW